eukprot:scaffold366170_cov33-Prasinocladus_malaysianus.AAC.1
MHIIQGVAGFKQLVRLAGRCFYSGQHPKPEEPKAGAAARRRLDTSGLCIVVLDALTRREWIEVARRELNQLPLSESLSVNVVTISAWVAGGTAGRGDQGAAKRSP